MSKSHSQGESLNHTSTFLKLAKSLTKLEYSLPVDLEGGTEEKRTEEKRTKENGSKNKSGKFSDY